MDTTFLRAVEFAFRWEKYYSNNSKDPGGETIWGVSSRWFPEEVKVMKKMTEAEAREYAKEFYRREFWNRLNCDNLSYPFDWIIFDTAVNQGMVPAKQLFAHAQGDFKDFLLQRIFRYVALPGQVLEGWINRVESLYKEIREG